ncbi:MAG: TolC family protein [Lentisphaerae bacterium]|nr:TolC family protein [Lentisphaerota bacterium]
MKYLLSSLIAVSCLAGCRSTRPSDRAVAREIRRYVGADPYLSESNVTNAMPASLSERPAPPPMLSLEVALRVAAAHSRSLQEQRDQLHRSTLALLRTRRDFGLALAGTLSYLFRDSDEGSPSESGALTLSASRILPSGGDVSLSGRLGRNTASSTNTVEAAAFDSSLSLRVDQPLLAGAGYGVSHEGLTQAQRSLLYALRGFALDRQDAAIASLEGFYALLLQRSVLENTRINVAQSSQLRARSEALFSVNRAPAIDVLRSQQQELSASNQLNRTVADYDGQIRRYLLTLGLSVEATVDIQGEVPDVAAMPTDETACIERALLHRLDLQTVADQVVDAERRLRRARSWLLPDLNLYGAATLSDEDAASLGEQALDGAYEAGITLELPLDKRDERDAVKLAELDLNAARRTLDQKRDQVRLDVIENFTRLRFLAGAVSIERQNIGIAEKRARNAMLRFRNGELLNRDVVEAENELLTARNAYARVRVDYEVQRIRLLRNIGALDVRADGLLVELALE